MRKQNLGEVRIISGQWRGRKLRFPVVSGLRPTSDRVRETLFNWLQPVITGASCLDLFAGSGALGIEALSRHAAFVAFVDNNSTIIHYLQQQLMLLENHNHTLIYGHVPSPAVLQSLLAMQKFDIVFLDPPFKKNLLQPCINWLATHALLAPQAYIYIESEIELIDLKLPADWKILHHKKTKEVNYYLVQTC